jgi:hypothetical protein
VARNEVEKKVLALYNIYFTFLGFISYKRGIRMRYLSNAFSLGMIDTLHHSDGGCSVANFRISGCSLRYAREWVAKGPWQSCVGHADTALLLSELLSTEVLMRRVSTSLVHGDSILVAQYNGPRLPEGCKTLPEDAKIRWYEVEYPDCSE